MIRWRPSRHRRLESAGVLGRVKAHAGSCLGLGGGLTYSAAAALLDINKQVLYARNEQGAVIARQPLAISHKDELAPFAVYRESAAPAVQRAFDRYDTELASALGIARGRSDPGLRYRERVVAGLVGRRGLGSRALARRGPDQAKAQGAP